MENDYKIKALDKLFNKLVVPKVNSLEDRTGFKILDILVGKPDTKEIELLDKPFYYAYVTVSSKKEFMTDNDAEDFYISLGPLL